MRKAVFFDVDGTLISYSTNPGRVPEPTLEALRLLKDRGHVVSLATGRSLITAGRLMRDLEIGHAVLCGGAHIVVGGGTLSLSYIDSSCARSIARRSVERGCTVFACTDEYLYVSAMDDDFIAYVREQTGRVDMIKPLDRMESACMMSIYGDNLPCREECSSVSATFEKDYIEIRPCGVSKATGIQKLAEHYGIAMRDTVAFGDGSNDVEMLKAAGIGIAVGNGNDRAKSAADIVTGPIDEGGILVSLKQLDLI